MHQQSHAQISSHPTQRPPLDISSYAFPPGRLRAELGLVPEVSEGPALGVIY